VEIWESVETEKGEIRVFPSEQTREEIAEVTITEALHGVASLADQRDLCDFISCLARRGDGEVFSGFGSCLDAAGLPAEKWSACVRERGGGAMAAESALFRSLGLDSQSRAFLINNQFLLVNQTPEQAIEIFQLLNNNH
jgi:hypothetical protein